MHRNAGIICRNSTCVSEGAKILRRIEAEARCGPKTACALSLTTCAMGLGAVFKDGNASRVSDLQHLLHVVKKSIQMGNDNCSEFPFGDHLAQVVKVHQ